MSRPPQGLHQDDTGATPSCPKTVDAMSRGWRRARPMTFGARVLEGWPLLVILLGVAASLAWTGVMLWAVVQLLRWVVD